MAKQKILQKKHKITNDTAVITETVEKTLTHSELLMEKQRYIHEQHGIVEQMKKLRQRHDQLTDAIDQVEKIISGFKNIVPEIPEETKK